MLEQIQRAYNEMRTHFTQPGAILGRTEQDDACVYYGDDGMRCAVGVRLPAEWIERMGVDKINAAGSVYSLVLNYPETQEFIGHVLESDPRSGFPTKLDNLLLFHAEAQNEHDTSATPDEFVHRLDALAESYGLVIGPDAELVEFTRELIPA